MQAFRVGRIGGIDIKVDASWILIFLLLTWSLGAMFGSWHPQWGFSLSLVLGGIAALLFFASVLAHELGHCVVAIAYGVPVRDITLHLFGGLASIERDAPSPKAEFWMAVAGPGVSFALALLSSAAGSAVFMLGDNPSFVWTGADMYRQFGPVTTLLLWLGTANLVVGLFNLLPGLPLDGGRVLRATLWAVLGNARAATRWAAMAGQLIGWTLVFAGILMAFGTAIPFLGQGFGAGLWTALIGWFLRNAAVQTFQGAVLEDMLQGFHASDVMRKSGPWVRADMTVRSLIEQAFLRHEDSAYPVFEGGEFLGIVTIDDVRRVPEDERAFTNARRVMTPKERMPFASPKDPLFEALRKLRQGEMGLLPVVEDGKLVGTLFEVDVARWIELRGVAEQRPAAARAASQGI